VQNEILKSGEVVFVVVGGETQRLRQKRRA